MTQEQQIAADETRFLVVHLQGQVGDILATFDNEGDARADIDARALANAGELFCLFTKVGCAVAELKVNFKGIAR